MVKYNGKDKYRPLLFKLTRKIEQTYKNRNDNTKQI